MEKIKELFNKLPQTLRQTITFTLFIIFLMILRVYVASRGGEGLAGFLLINGFLIYLLVLVGRDYFYEFYEYGKYIPEDDDIIRYKKRKKEDRDNSVLKKFVLIFISVVVLVPTNLIALNNYQTERYESMRAFEEQRFINSLPSNTTTTTVVRNTTTSTTTNVPEERGYRGIFPWEEDVGKKATIQKVTLPVDKGIIANINITPKETVRDYKIIYPQIEDHNSQNCYDTINKEIKNIVTAYVERDLEGEEFRKEFKEEEYDPGGYTFYSWLYLEYEIIEASNEIFSAFFYWDSYGAGAAHPISDPFSINYDIGKCEKINFNKFFDETELAGLEPSYSLYKQVIEVEVLKQLCAQDGIVIIDNCEYVDLFKFYYEYKFGKERSEKWNIFDSATTSFGVGQYGIFVQFWEYDFYYASGSELILLPWSKISSILDPNSIYSEILNSYSQRQDLATTYEPEWDF